MDSQAPAISAGHELELHAGPIVTIATVDELADGALLVRAAEPLQQLEGLTLLYGDDAGAAWEVEAACDPPGPDGRLRVAPTTAWQQIPVGRLSQRVSCHVQMYAEAIAGSLPEGVRIEFVCIDASASGLRAAVAGRVPATGDRMRIALGFTTDRPNYVDAKVARVVPGVFGRSEVGFRFDPQSDAESRWILPWRDSLMRQAA